jgi:hypothetical protein
MNSFFRSAIIRKSLLMMLFMPFLGILSISGAALGASPDTTWSVSFRLNMTKTVNQHIFLPDSDYVYLVMDGTDPLKLVPGPDYTYTATLFDQLDSGVTYFYKFSINDSLQETVTRSFTARPGMVNLSAWWNNEPINLTSFVVDMQFAAQSGLFNPLADSVCIVGTMNNMQGSPKLVRVDTTFKYKYIDSISFPGAVHEYKYRINADSSGLELLDKPARMVRIADTIYTVACDFNNINPGKRLMTFHCDMDYYVEAHHFDANNDYLDLAGNFNGNGANDVLFDMDGDTIFTLETYLDTAWFHQEPLSFKFRINGNWNTTELVGKPNRTYIFHDTVNQDPNIFSCYYNDLNPNILTPPWVYDVDIQGLLIYKKFLSGIYSYENVNGIPEGISTYRWLRSTNAQGSDATPIDSAWKITYVVDTLDIGKWLVFEVTPKAISGDSAVGQPVRVVSSNSISAWDVGIDEYALITRVYPNPATDVITVLAKKEITQVELINYLNQVVLVNENVDSKSCRLNLGPLPRGIYLLKATSKSGDSGVVRVVKF